MKNIARLFILIFVFFFQVSLSENYWIRTKVEGPLPYLFRQATGESCLIFTKNTGQSVHAFDINSGRWKTLLVSTKLEWLDAQADGNTAMVYNDSVVVAYSAITSSFASLVYEGKKATLSAATHGCIDNSAYFITDKYFYVFDATDGEWRSFLYTHPGAQSLGGGVIGKSDYVYLSLWILNESPQTLVAYSNRTQTFSELTEPSIYAITQLDHGFAFARRNKEPYMCGGYSAYTGEFKTQNHASEVYNTAPSTYLDIVSPLICNAFTTNQLIAENTMRFKMIVYNTVLASFKTYTIVYALNDDYQPAGTYCGGQCAFTTINEKDAFTGDRFKIKLLVYSALDHSYKLFDTPLLYWGFNGFQAGGLMFDGIDDRYYFLYDVKTNKHMKHSVSWTEGIQPGLKGRGLGNYWSVFAYTEQYNDVTHVFSYNRDDNRLHSFDFSQRASSSAYRGSDFHALLPIEAGVATKALLYSPIHNSWIEKDFQSSDYHGSSGNYFYINYADISQLKFYDSETNQELSFPSAERKSHVLARDSIFFMYSAGGKYIGYSLMKHESKEYVTNKLSGQTWGNFVVLNHNSYMERYKHLLYDAYNNIFAPLTLTAEEGIRMYSYCAGKTAYIITQNGYLYAYYPDIASTTEDNRLKHDHDSHFVFQNYPNPFKSSTKIKYVISPDHTSNTQNDVQVSIKVYNTLGKEISTLVNERKSAGKYEIDFLAKDIPGGIYFCTLTIGDKFITRKIILH